MRPGDVVVVTFNEKEHSFNQECVWGHVHHIYDSKVVVAFLHDQSWTFRTFDIEKVEQPHRVTQEFQESSAKAYNLNKGWITPRDVHNIWANNQQVLEAQVQKTFHPKSWWTTAWERWEPRLDILAELVQEALGRFVLRLRGGR